MDLNPFGIEVKPPLLKLTALAGVYIFFYRYTSGTLILLLILFLESAQDKSHHSTKIKCT